VSRGSLSAKRMDTPSMVRNCVCMGVATDGVMPASYLFARALRLRISDGVGRGIQILSTRHARYWTMVSVRSLLHEATNELGNLIRRGIEREVTRIEDVDFGLRHVSAIGLRFRKLERQVVFAPEDE
jgi:hypothetical protein